MNKLPNLSLIVKRKIENTNPTPFGANRLAIGAGAPVRLTFLGGQQRSRPPYLSALLVFKTSFDTYRIYCPCGYLHGSHELPRSHYRLAEQV